MRQNCLKGQNINIKVSKWNNLIYDSNTFVRHNQKRIYIICRVNLNVKVYCNFQYSILWNCIPSYFALGINKLLLGTKIFFRVRNKYIVYFKINYDKTRHTKKLLYVKIQERN